MNYEPLFTGRRGWWTVPLTDPRILPLIKRFSVNLGDGGLAAGGWFVEVDVIPATIEGEYSPRGFLRRMRDEEAATFIVPYSNPGREASFTAVIDAVLKTAQLRGESFGPPEIEMSFEARLCRSWTVHDSPMTRLLRRAVTGIEETDPWVGVWRDIKVTRDYRYANAMLGNPKWAFGDGLSSVYDLMESLPRI